MKSKSGLKLIVTACVLIFGGSLMFSGTACSNSGDFKETEAAPAMKTTPAQQAPAGQAAQPAAASGGYHGTVTETMNASGYTYVQLDTGEEKVWAAAPQFKVAVGDEASFAATMPMKDFKSETLGRSFDLVYFVSHVNLGGAAAAEAAPHDHGAMAGADKAPGTGPPPVVEAEVSGIAKAAGGFTVAEIYAGKGALSGSEVSVRGKVVKFNSGILGRNWLHIQDGSGSAGTNDLTITSDQAVKVGDTVLVTGILASNKDFGSGYRYEVLVEEASITVE